MQERTQDVYLAAQRHLGLYTCIMQLSDKMGISLIKGRKKEKHSVKAMCLFTPDFWTMTLTSGLEISFDSWIFPEPACVTDGV